MEEAQNQTKKLMPGAVVDLNGIRNPQAVNKLNRCIGIVKQETGLDEVKVILADANMRDQTAGSFSEEKGILRLNPNHLNRSDQWYGLKVRENGAYDGLFSNIYRGKEVESIIFHELYHAAALKIVKGKDGAERYRKLREAYDRAKKEKFNLSKHGMDDEYEFLSELKTGKQLANAEYPDYIENMLKEFFL